LRQTGPRGGRAEEEAATAPEEGATTGEEAAATELADTVLPAAEAEGFTDFELLLEYDPELLFESAASEFELELEFDTVIEFEVVMLFDVVIEFEFDVVIEFEFDTDG